MRLKSELSQLHEVANGWAQMVLADGDWEKCSAAPLSSEVRHTVPIDPPRRVFLRTRAASAHPTSGASADWRLAVAPPLASG